MNDGFQLSFESSTNESIHINIFIFKRNNLIFFYRCAHNVIRFPSLQG